MSKQPSKIKIIYVKREYPIEVMNYDILAHFKNWDLLPYNDILAPPKPDQLPNDDDSEDWTDING